MWFSLKSIFTHPIYLTGDPNTDSRAALRGLMFGHAIRKRDLREKQENHVVPVAHR